MSPYIKYAMFAMSSSPHSNGFGMENDSCECAFRISSFLVTTRETHGSIISHASVTFDMNIDAIRNDDPIC